jgi:hypothetical protein
MTKSTMANEILYGLLKKLKFGSAEKSHQAMWDMVGVAGTHDSVLRLWLASASALNWGR